MLLLHSRGAKSNLPRVNPLGYIKDGDNFVVVASKGGEPTNPDWYYNLQVHPDVTIEVGTEQFKVHATIPERAEPTASLPRQQGKNQPLLSISETLRVLSQLLY